MRRTRKGVRLAAFAVVCLLLTACTGSGPDGPPTPQPSPPPAASPIARDYWPTAGWRTAEAKDQGVDAAQLAQLEGQVATAFPQIRSVLVVRHGYLVYERYWHGSNQSSGHDMASVTKSVVGALVGIALAEGKIESLDQTVGELLPTQLPADADPRFAGVTVRQLLTMTSGLASDDPISGDPTLDEDLMRSPDWVRHILGRRLESEPGTRFAYSNAGAHLLSAIVADSSGESTLAFARAKLFDPLGIRTQKAYEPVAGEGDPAAVEKTWEMASVAWARDPQGYHFGAGYERLPARDLAKIGYLYLNGGQWDTTQVIPADYVAASTSPKGSSPNLSMGYGWLWWVRTEAGHRAFFAQGLGGQYIYVFPDLDLVTVITSDLATSGLDPKNLLSQTIVPAVTG